jgi:hypothetical protein
VEVADDGRFASLAAGMGVRATRVATTTATYRFGFADGSAVALDALYETWSAPLRDFYAAVPR